MQILSRVCASQSPEIIRRASQTLQGDISSEITEKMVETTSCWLSALIDFSNPFIENYTATTLIISFSSFPNQSTPMWILEPHACNIASRLCWSTGKIIPTTKNHLKACPCVLGVVHVPTFNSLVYLFNGVHKKTNMAQLHCAACKNELGNLNGLYQVRFS